MFFQVGRSQLPSKSGLLDHLKQMLNLPEKHKGGRKNKSKDKNLFLAQINSSNLLNYQRIRRNWCHNLSHLSLRAWDNQ